MRISSWGPTKTDVAQAPQTAKTIIYMPAANGVLLLSS